MPMTPAYPPSIIGEGFTSQDPTYQLGYSDDRIDVVTYLLQLYDWFARTYPSFEHDPLAREFVFFATSSLLPISNFKSRISRLTSDAKAAPAQDQEMYAEVIDKLQKLQPLASRSQAYKREARVSAAAASAFNQQLQGAAPY
jgi:hypothetical protein